MIVRQFRKHAGLLAVIAAILAVAVQFGWSAADPATGPVPVTANPVTFTASPVTDLTAGSDVVWNITTSGSTKLVGFTTAHLCVHGKTSYSSQSFGFNGPQGVNCVLSSGIFDGGISGADYEATTGPYSGSESTLSEPQHFKVGTGSVSWVNSTNDGPTTVACDTDDRCDLVVQVNLSGDSKASQTYFIQPLTFAGGGSTTTTTTSTGLTTTTGAATTTTGASTTTTTTVAPTTTKATTTTTTPVTTTTVDPNGSVTPSTVGPNGAVTVTSTGWDAGSVVKVTLHSDPVVLGTLTANDAGTASGPFTIPAGTAPGDHTLELTYNDPAVGSRTVSLSLTVASTTTATIASGTGTGTGTGTTGSSTAGALAFTGGNVRSLASIALLLIAAGLFILGRLARRPADAAAHGTTDGQ
jgi:hypothetical protein